MNLDTIKSISFSLMKKETDMDKGRAEYTKKLTAKFVLPSDFPKKEEMFESLVKNMYDDLVVKIPEDVDSLGLWIECESTIFENAITLNTLIDIQQYSKQNVNPIFEFFKLTLTQ